MTTHFILEKKFILLYLALLLFIQGNSQATASIPHLKKTGNVTQLIVHDKPFLILGGELGNSTASVNAYMQPIWPQLKARQLNTVLMPVYWELVEPQENNFDF